MSVWVVRGAGRRYLKTTLFGLTGCSPDYVMLIVGGNAGLIGMSKVSKHQSWSTC